MNKYIWNLTKITAVAFNSIATSTVFYTIFHDTTGSWIIAALAALLAIILIDLQFISLVNFLEDNLKPGEYYQHRKPYAVGLAVLYACIVAIGFKDEGIYAAAPRVGLGIMVLVSEYRYWMLSKAESDLHWQEEFERRKAKAEKEDSLRLAKDKRKIKNHEQKEALKSVRAQLREKYRNDIRRDMGLLPDVHAVLKPAPQVHAAPELPVQVHADLPVLHARKSNSRHDSVPQVVSEGVHADKRGYSWECPDCGAGGKGLRTAKGAQIARSRHMNSAHEISLLESRD